MGKATQPAHAPSPGNLLQVYAPSVQLYTDSHECWQLQEYEIAVYVTNVQDSLTICDASASVHACIIYTDLDDSSTDD